MIIIQPSTKYVRLFRENTYLQVFILIALSMSAYPFFNGYSGLQEYIWMNSDKGLSLSETEIYNYVEEHTSYSILRYTRALGAHFPIILIVFIYYTRSVFSGKGTRGLWVFVIFYELLILAVYQQWYSYSLL